MTCMQRDQVKFDSTTYLQLHGKGRKERVVPLWAKTGRVLRNWFRECEIKATKVAFPSVRGTPLSSDGLNYILQQAVRRAADASCPSLLTKRVTPHLVRHYLPFLTMSGNGEPLRIWIGDFRSRPAKLPNITRHSLMPVTDCSRRRVVGRRVYSDPALHAAGMS
jgi:integrase